MFYKNDDTFVHFQSRPKKDEVPKIPAGIYTFVDEEMFTPPMFHPVKLKEQSLISLETVPYRRLVKAATQFFDPELRAKAARFKVPHRMGALLHGPQGTGKSTLIRNVLEEMARTRNVIGLINDDLGDLGKSISLLRENDPGREVIVIWEEFDNWVGRAEGYIKGILDGISSPENVLFIATTNYLERIPETLTDRPGRFAHVLKIDFFNTDERRYYITRLLDAMSVSRQERELLDIEAIISRTAGRSADDIKHILLNCLVYGTNLEESIGQMEQATRDREEAVDKDVKKRTKRVLPRAISAATDLVGS